MDQVQLFISDINQLGSLTSTLPFLNAEEKKRLSAFKDDSARALFGHGRRMMKTLLGSRLNRPPGNIQFSYSDHGKPYLPQQRKLHFNLSHSGDTICFGLAGVHRSGPPSTSSMALNGSKPTQSAGATALVRTS